MGKCVIGAAALLLITTACAAGERRIAVALTVPDTTWRIAIDEVYRVGDALWVVAAVSQPPDAMGAQVISTVEDTLVLDAPDLPVKVFVLGKTWNWPNQEPYDFIDARDQIEADLRQGHLLHRRQAGN